MPAEPVVERIEQDIENTLASVRVANGYSYDLLPQRETEGGNKLDDYSVLIIAQEMEELPQTPLGHMLYRQPYTLVVFLPSGAGDAEPEPKTRRMNRIWRDIRQALIEGSDGLSRHRGNLAEETHVRPPRAFAEEDGTTGFVVAVEVDFKTLEFDAARP